MQVHSSSALPHGLCWYCVHLSGVLLADFRSEHTPLFAPLPLLCEPWHRMCSPFLEPNASVLLPWWFPSLFCLSAFLFCFCYMCKGTTVQEGDGQMSCCLEIVISLFLLGCVAVKLACWWICPSGLPREGEPIARIYSETSEMWFLEVLLWIMKKSRN